MKSIAFFLGVCSLMLLVLYLTVETGPESGAPAGAGTPGTAAERGAEPPAGGDPAAAGEGSRGAESAIDLPFYDVKAGRLAYRLRGELPPDVFNFNELEGPKRYTLDQGLLVIPIYDDFKSNIPRGVDKMNEIALSFSRAEYEEVRAEGGGTEERIRLTGGGEGRADDGTVIRFDDLQIVISKPAGYVYTVRSTSPISIENSLLEIRSPTGLEGLIRGDRDLERLTFLPPVTTYVDARSAKLFSLGPVAVPPPAGSGTESGARARRGIAVTCAGPLVLDRTTEPPRIEFQDDVWIFPVERPDAAARAPEPGDTWFRCQRLALLIHDDEESAPVLTGAVATWPGGRVRAAHGGYRVDGDRLGWESGGGDAGKGERDGGGAGSDGGAAGAAGGAAGAAESVATLTGRPVLTGPLLDLEADVARFRLQERRIEVEGGVTGEFRLTGGQSAPEKGKRGVRAGKEERGTTAKGGAGSAKAPSTGSAPERTGRWKVVASRFEIDFAAPGASRAAEATGAPDEPRGGRRKRGHRRDALDRVARMAAESAEPGGLVLSDLEGETVLRGRRMTYDGVTGIATLAGDPGKPPGFRHGRSSGAAESISLERDGDDILIHLAGEVHVGIDEAEIQRLRATAAPAGPRQRQPRVGEARPQPASLLAGGLEIAASRVTVRLDGERRIRAVTAEGEDGRLVRLAPRGKGVPYRIESPNLAWDSEAQVATMEAIESGGTTGGGGRGNGDGTFVLPALRFAGRGVLRARRIRFDRGHWTAELEGGIEIRGEGPSGRTAAEGDGPAAGPPPLLVTADRAEVEFFEWFRPEGEDDPCLGELRTVRSLRAWAPAGGMIEIAASGYSAQAERATWSAERQELRLFGEREQVFRRHDRGRIDTLTAREIVYSRSTGKVLLRGGVSGSFFLRDRSRRKARPARLPPTADAPDTERPPAAAGGAPDGSDGSDGPAAAAGLRWDYVADSIDLEVEPLGDCRSLALVSLAGHDRIVLENSVRGLRLQGDDLIYDGPRQEVRIFSRTGRYQTLTQQTKGPDGAARTNTIDAREIRVWFVRQPALPGAPRPGAEESVIVRFYDDVSAAFSPGRELELPVAGAPDEDGVWKLRADYLGLRIVPGAAPREMVQSAYAAGEVIFTSGDMKALAREAIVDGARRLLILRGDDRTKVQLSSGTRTFADDVITLSRKGSRFRITSRGRRADDRGAVDLVRPEPR